jgi:hypothetical protein
MKRSTKVVLVIGGYLLAILVACVVVSIYVSATSGPDRQGADGMYAFGDSMVFLAAFGLASIPATCAALYFLRAAPRFWSVLSVVALAIAVTGLAAAFIYFSPPAAAAHSALHTFAMLTPIRILIAPLFILAFLLAGLFAPARSPRLALLLAMAIEATVFVFVVYKWLHPG